jgi:hypothetical protein
MERELRRALRRVEPSPGFAERTVARLAEAPAPVAPPAVARGGASRWLGLGVAASLVAATAVGWVQAVRRAEAEQARQDVELALRITTEKLQEVQSKVQARVAAFRDRQF